MREQNDALASDALGGDAENKGLRLGLVSDKDIVEVEVVVVVVVFVDSGSLEKQKWRCARLWSQHSTSSHIAPLYKNITLHKNQVLFGAMQAQR